MAKGQKRSSREAKKPKKPKGATPKPGASGAAAAWPVQAKLDPAARSKKKG